MEERKRPASYDHDDSAPPLKRQATSVNGGSKGHPDDMPWKDELERFQKEAIWRQMQEYKRERNTLEARLNDLTKRTAYHDDHLRIIDAWFGQLLDEAKMIVGQVDNHAFVPSFPSALLTADNSTFEEHLELRSSEISSAISQLFSRSVAPSPEVSELQGRITHLLFTEKVHIVELEKSRSEKEQLEERLESASLRYMVAEKKLERAKSATVAKLERQATAGGRESGSGIGGGAESSGKKDSDGLNGVDESNDGAAEATEVTRREAVAASIKQKEQLEKLEADNEKLTAQLTTLNIKMSRLSDDDCARTDLFKQLKSQHEDVIKRINNLEATNNQLREEAEKLQAERTAYRVQMENEAQAALGEKEAQLTRAESDLARIRTGRDELIADNQMRKAAQDQERGSINQVRELAAARAERISALESEIERLKIELGHADSGSVPQTGLGNLSAEELRTKYQNLERQYSMLEKEVPLMVSALKRASTLASQKISDLSALEDKVVRLGAEKSKADQKYFAAMKAKEARDQEVRTLRAQNSKSSDIVSQLKDAEASTRALVINLEKQLAESKEAITNISNRNRTSQQQLLERTTALEGSKAQVEELKKMLTTKDASLSTVSSSYRKAEVEIEELKVRLDETKQSLKGWKNKSLATEGSEETALRMIAYCTVCRKNLKDTALKTCGHVFCKDCVEERLTSRSRKCPSCNKSFGTNDHMRVTL
ncbi:e3 ubiquitin-protein ligase bre1 [Lasallia pustulata]|uniref:E3 ubiquitin protein ligase n=1 Tax=Lasallia pustulata TaxID=136370 RepID=A0A1W5D7J6_9LECA|nr:e3 ubiquitin-protein ligase bre1 [Lasallia pustulata]